MCFYKILRVKTQVVDLRLFKLQTINRLQSHQEIKVDRPWAHPWCIQLPICQLLFHKVSHQKREVAQVIYTTLLLHSLSTLDSTHLDFLHLHLNFNYSKSEYDDHVCYQDVLQTQNHILLIHLFLNRLISFQVWCLGAWHSKNESNQQLLIVSR